MDQTRQDAARTAARRPWPAGRPQAGQPGANLRDARPDMRVSDAERDAVVTELGEHFGQGRLDQAEFDERVTKALSARTGRDLSGLLADLPPAREEPSGPQPGTQLPGPFLFFFFFFFLILIAGAAAGGWV